MAYSWSIRDSKQIAEIMRFIGSIVETSSEK